MSGRLDRVVFPAAGLCRADLLRYYARVADGVVGALLGRTVTVVRYPRGLAAPGFFQKHQQRAGGRQPIRIEDPMDLLRWVRLGAVEFHAPLGPASAASSALAPHDWAVMDLDPNPPAGWACVVHAARVVATVFAHVGLPMQVKTSGRRGVHLMVPIEPLAAAEATQAMERLARVACALWPEGVTVARRVSDRGPRVYLDYLQNGPHRTMAAVYGVRALEPAPISWPTSLPALPAWDSRAATVGKVLAGTSVPAWERGTPVNLAAAMERAGIPTAEELRRAGSRRPAPRGESWMATSQRQEVGRAESSDATCGR